MQHILLLPSDHDFSKLSSQCRASSVAGSDSRVRCARRLSLLDGVGVRSRELIKGAEMTIHNQVDDAVQVLITECSEREMEEGSEKESEQPTSI